MKLTIIVDCPSGFQNNASRRIRRQHNIPGAITRSRGVCNKISVQPFDRVADLRRHLRRHESEILNLNLDYGGVR
jgi:hypothetical protein